MYKLKVLMIFSLLCFLLISCSQEKQTIQKANIAKQSEEKAEVDFLTGSDFHQSSDFEIFTLNPRYNENNNEIVFNMTYSFGENPKKMLMDGNHSYYFSLDAPEEYKDSFESLESFPSQGEQLVNNDSKKYNVNIIFKLKPNLSSDKIKSILQNPFNYKLKIYENKNYPAKIIINIYEKMKLDNK